MVAPQVRQSLLLLLLHYLDVYMHSLTWKDEHFFFSPFESYVTLHGAMR